jgi:hypothetical protein
MIAVGLCTKSTRTKTKERGQARLPDLELIRIEAVSNLNGIHRKAI